MPRLDVVFSLLALLLLGACAQSSDQPGRVVEDDLARPITLRGPVARIVTVAPSATELVFAVGAGDRVVGVSTADDYPPAVAALDRVQALPLDFEAIVTLNPDLIVASDQVNDPRDAETLEKLGIPTWFTSVGSLADVPRAMRRLGAALQSSETASAAADSLERLRAGLAASAAGSGDGPGVLFLIGQEQLFSFGSGSYIHEMIALAGGRSLTANLESRGPILSEEFVIDAAPDIILGSFADGETAESLLRRHPSWLTVPALAKGAVYAIDPDLCLRPGPRLFEGTLRMREALQSP